MQSKAKCKKVGILTQYYKSHNYGGLLQAYALVKVIESIGFSAEQICYDSKGENNQHFFSEQVCRTRRKSTIRKVKDGMHSVLDATVRGKINKRNYKLEKFGELIPHSAEVFTHKSLYQVQGEYFAYVVGSDQVWNPKFYFPAYFCDFVNEKETKCISYAASVSQNRLTEKEKDVYRTNLKKFSAISLRENNLEIIQELTDTDVQWVLDPTLLLEKEKWDSICAPRCCTEPYVFCYFLGRDVIEREKATAFAKAQGLKLVNIPHLSGSYELLDRGFGDIHIVSASVEDFISLIKHAEYIITDSFHATVFSHIYHKNFFVFQRAEASGMSTRIYSLLELCGTTKRFCDSVEKLTLEYLLQLSDIDYTTANEKIADMRVKSMNFLRDNLC